MCPRTGTVEGFCHRMKAEHTGAGVIRSALKDTALPHYLPHRR